MSGKITQAEFQDWSQKFRKLTEETLNLPFTSPEIKKQFIQSMAVGNFYCEKEWPNAVFVNLAILGMVGIRTDTPLSVLGGITFLVWEEQVFQRLKEHYIAEGYYNPANPPNLTSLRERKKEANKKLADPQYLNRLLIYANSEEYKFITNLAGFNEQWEKIYPANKEEIDDETLRNTDFMVVNWVGMMEKLDNLLKQAEKTKPPTNNSTPPVPPVNSDYSTNLGNEIADLKNQVKQLEGKIKDKLPWVNPAEKEINQNLLEDIKKRLDNKEKEFQKIQKQGKDDKTTNSNSNLPLIIGVSAVAIVFLLIVIIVLLARSGRRRD